MTTSYSLSEEEKQKRCEAELEFTVACLQKNPKSYAGWHQRRWAMLQAPQPPWLKERGLCHKFLSLDERNCRFHELEL